MKAIILLIFSVLPIVGILAQNVEISGNAKTYARDTLIFYTYRDYITLKKAIEIKTVVDTAGNFKIETESSGTQCFYVDLNVFRGRIFTQAGKKYTISLPKKTLKDETDRQNPYFVPQDFFIRILSSDSNDLNTLISKFDQKYTQYFEKLFADYNNSPSAAKTETIIKQLNDSFPSDSNLYFENYKKYEFASMRFLTYNHNANKLISENFLTSPQFDNPAYNEASGQIIGNYFDKAKNSSELQKALVDKNWNELNSVLINDSLFRITDFREFVLIQSLTKLFYEQTEMKKNITEILIQASRQCKNQINRQVASDFAENSAKLLNGNSAPDFLLESETGQKMSLTQFSGKFVYLNFFSPESYAGMKDLALLKNLYNQKLDLLEIVTIWNSGKIQDMKDFIKKNDCRWTFLFCDNKKLLKEYNVRVFPTYFLLNPEAVLLAAPAFAPEDDFAARYYIFYQNRKNELLKRKDNRKLNN